jgi:hypothetical protein
MIAVYFALGLLFFFTDIANKLFPDYRKELGATLMIYPVIRLIILIRKRKREKENGI